MECIGFQGSEAMWSYKFAAELAIELVTEPCTLVWFWVNAFSPSGRLRFPKPGFQWVFIYQLT